MSKTIKQTSHVFRLKKPDSPWVQIFQALSRWFEREQRQLPWRNRPEIYRVWVSEIMLQQTQVVTVLPFFERFMARFPSLASLAAADVSEVLVLWSGLGYYSRGRRLHEAARLIQAGGGSFPETRAGWLAIPGVGEYTAGAILSIALHQAEPLLDGNVERVLARLRRIARGPNYTRRLWRLARLLVLQGVHQGIDPSALNQSLMELGATVCTVRQPQCPRCPLRPGCKAHALLQTSLFPQKKAPKKWRTVQETVHAVISPRGQWSGPASSCGPWLLLEQREKGAWRAGLWDFLSNPVDFAALGLSAAQKLTVVETSHVVTQHKIRRTTEVWSVSPEVVKAALGLHEGRRRVAGPELRWVLAQGGEELACGSAFRKSWAAVQQQLSLLLPLSE